MKPARFCDQCHEPLPGDAPEGLCPKCLLQFGRVQLGLAAPEPTAHSKGFSPEAESYRFGNYELLDRIGQGGMGAVYKARQLNLDRIVALKLLPLGPWSSPGLAQRLRSEAKTAAALQHPNIVAVHDVGECEGQPFFSMDFVEGRTLAELVRDRPLPAPQAAAYLKTIAEAVHYAHQQGVLHRDLKPSNILIDRADEPRITDFGLAKRLRDQQPATAQPQITLTGEVLGSPDFMSPEQAEGRAALVGPHSDVYSLGALLYHLLTRQPPFQADTLTTLLKQVLEAEPVPPRSLNPNIPKDLETICLKCLEKEPSRRYPTAQALADDLHRFLGGKPVRARPIGAVGRTWRWCHRQPVRAGLIGGLAVAVLLGTAGISSQWHRAERERQIAISNERLALHQAYASDINLVQRSLEEGDLGQARQFLDKYRSKRTPQSGKQKLESDLRGWEWRYLWGLSRGDEQFQLTHRSQNSASLVKLLLAPDGNLLALRDESGNIELWDLALRQHTGSLSNQGSERAMAFIPNSNLLASGNRDANGKPVISFWDLATKQIVRNLPQSDEVTSLDFSPDGRWLATYQTEAVPRMRLWELPGGRLVKELPASEPVNGVMRIPLFSPNGKILALGEMNGEIRLLELATGVMRNIPPSREGNGVNALAFSPEGGLLAAGYGYSDGPIRLWDVTTTNLVGSLEGHRSYICQLVFAPDGQTLYSASADQSIRVWDLVQKKQVGRLQGHVGVVTGLALCPGDGTLISCSSDKSVLVWDPRNPRQHRSQDTFAGLGCLFGAEFTADSRRFLTACLTNPVTLWDVATADPIARFPALGTNNKSLTLSLDERLVAVGGVDGTLKIADLRSGRLVKKWRAHRYPVSTVWFVRGGTALFSCGWVAHQQFEPKLWDTASWQEIPCPFEGGKPIYGAALSRDHRLLAVAYGREPIKIWDTISGRVNVLAGSEWGFGPGFSADGHRLAAAFGSHVRIWEVQSGRELPSVQQPLNMVASAAFSPDGKRLVTGLATSGDIQPALRFWDPESGRDLLSLHGHGAWTQQIQFSPDGNAVLAVSYYGIADLWRAPSWAEIEAAEDANGTGPARQVTVSGVWVTNPPSQTQREGSDRGALASMCTLSLQTAPIASATPEESWSWLINPVIARDDFEDGKLEGWTPWSSHDQGYLLETNGCLSVQGYWPGRRGCENCWAKGWRATPLVSLADGQTLERRVGLVSMSQSTTLVNSSLCGSNINQGYTLTFGPRVFGLSKWMPGWAVLSCDKTRLPGSNVVLCLALTREHANLVVTGRVLDKEDPRRVLFERTVVDTPGIDATLSSSEAHAFIGVSYSGWTEDVQGSPWFTFDYADLEIVQENDGTKPKAVAVFDQFELRRYAASKVEKERGTQ